MGIIAWLIFGAIIGWIASKIMGTDAQQGALLNIVVGIVGALLGGWVANLLGMGAGFESFFDPWSWIIAIVGACLLLFLWGLVTGNRRRVR